MPKTPKNPADYIQPLYINRLRGRIMILPPPPGKKREIMYIQGHHSSLERNFGVAQLLNRYGGVTVPDLPGFGGMDPFYKIGEKPTLDNMADYLATVIKLRYRKSQKVTLTGLSMGFMVITRMLQKYPEIAKQVDVLVSFAGLVHSDDFNYKPTTFYFFKATTWIFSRRLAAAFLKYIAFRGPFIRLGYKVFEPLFVKKEKSKIQSADPAEQKRRIDFEIYLWQSNDPRTYMAVGHTMFKLDLTGRHVDLKVYHIAIAGDRYFNNVKVEQHMRQIFHDVKIVKSKPPAHAPSVIATAKEASPFLPPYMRRILSKPV